MPGLFTGATGLWGGFTGLLYGSSALSTPPGLLADAAWSPAQLFAQGEVGAWYDPSDLSTMFTDSAGTTPVTGVEQAVGLILDKSRGATLGSNLFPNDGVISSTTGWVAANNGTLSAVGGGLRIVGNGVTAAPKATYTLTVTSGVWVRIRMSWSGNSGGTTIFLNGGSTEGTITSSTAASGTFDAMIKATNTTMLVVPVALSATSDITYSNFSVRELPGNHASQSTPNSRPVLRARYNLLTYSEQFDNAAWNKQAGTVVTANQAIAPDGTLTADLVTSNGTNGIFYGSSVPGTSSIQTTKSIYLRGVTGGETVYLQDAAGTVGIVTCNLTTSWQRFSLSEVVGVNNQPWVKGIPSGGIYIWGADLRVTNESASLPAYQRIAAATDYDTTGFLPYLAFDGTDDFLVTGTINPGSVDKAQIFAGVRKLSDAAAGVVAEFSAAVVSNAGSFALFAPSIAAANYMYRARGSAAQVDASYTDAAIAAPVTNVVTGLDDISGDSALLRIDGVQRGSSTADQGTGNFLAYPLYIGRRAGTSLPANMRLYQFIVRFSAANLADSVIAQAETYTARYTGVTL